MDVIEGIQTRHSIRAFKDTPVPKEALQKILKASSLSPSYTNTQPWEVAVVTGKKNEDLGNLLYDLARNKAEIHPDLPSPYKCWAPEHAARCGEHGARRLAALGVERDDEAGREELSLRNFRFYGAPCAMFLFMEGALNEWSVFDMGLFTQNLILAAHSLGLESCLQASVANYSLEIKKFLNIAENKKMIICISLGYPDMDARLNTYQAVKQDPEAFTKWFD